MLKLDFEIRLTPKGLTLVNLIALVIINGTFTASQSLNAAVVREIFGALVGPRASPYVYIISIYLWPGFIQNLCHCC